MSTHNSRGDSNEYPQHVFLWRTDDTYPSVIIKYPPDLFFCSVLLFFVELQTD